MCINLPQVLLTQCSPIIGHCIWNLTSYSIWDYWHPIKYLLRLSCGDSLRNSVYNSGIGSLASWISLEITSWTRLLRLKRYSLWFRIIYPHTPGLQETSYSILISQLRFWSKYSNSPWSTRTYNLTYILSLGFQFPARAKFVPCCSWISLCFSLLRNVCYFLSFGTLMAYFTLVI